MFLKHTLYYFLLIFFIIYAIINTIMIEIDTNKLKRDYQKYPLKIIKRGKNSELPFKEDLEYLYIELNMSLNEITSYFNVDNNIFYSWLKNFNIKKDRKLSSERKKQTCLEKYGCEYVLQNKKIREKANQTKIEKYGDKNYNNIEKYKQTCLEKYGVDNISKITREKAKNTMLEKYGVDNYSKSKEAKEKQIKTNLLKYNRNCHTQQHISNKSFEIISNKNNLESFIKNQSNKDYISLSNQLDINTETFRRYIRKYNMEDLISPLINESSEEKELQKIYPFMKFHNKSILNGKEIDLYDEEHKIGIEFNGDFWHNEYGKKKNYHQQKSLLAEEKGIFLYHIFEYEWIKKKNKIINQLNNLLGINQKKIYARKCIIKEVDNKEKMKFLKENHLQGNDSSSVKLGLYYNNELVSLMTFCKPRFNKKYQYELSRFCSKNNCNVIGGASKLFKYFINNYDPRSIISYSNIAHTRGKLYETLGFNFNSISDPNYVWCNNNHNILTRYDCQKHKLKEQGFEGNTETEIMHNNRYYRIFDCGNKVWVWYK